MNVRSHSKASESTQSFGIKGFTLIELLIAMAMLAILAMLAVPSFSDYFSKNSIFSLKTDFVSALMTARSEALNRNKTMTVCPSSTVSSCSGSWSDGWVVFIDDGGSGGTARDGILNGSEEVVNAYRYTGNNNISVVEVGDTNTAITSLSFNEKGRPAQDGVHTSRRVLVTVCDHGNRAKFARGVLMIGSGRLVHTRDNDQDGYHESRFTDGSGTLDVDTKLSCSS